MSKKISQRKPDRFARVVEKATGLKAPGLLNNLICKLFRNEHKAVVRLVKQRPTISLARGDYDVQNQVVLVQWIQLDDLLAALDRMAR